MTFIQECGLRRPDPGWWIWLADRHSLLALLAAVPVFLILGLTMEGRMRVVVGWSSWMSFLLVQPVAEEFVFRGVLQGQLLRISSSRVAGTITLANLLTTCGFVALHFLTQPPGWALAVSIPSILFGHMRDRFGSVLPAVTMHIIYNAGFGLTALWIQR